MARTKQYQVHFLPKGIVLNCCEGQSIFDAAAETGIKLTNSCRNGNCYVCKAELVSGELECGYQGKVNASLGTECEVMTCMATPLTNCVLRMEKVFDRGELPLTEKMCTVLSVTHFSEHIVKVLLELPAGRLPEFYAGQYLCLEIPNTELSSYFSIASPPGERTIELHIQADPHLTSAVEMVQGIRDAEMVRLKLPMGKACFVAPVKGELILMAAGTGFAQMKSIIEHVLSDRSSSIPIYLYWGVRSESDMYAREMAEKWSKEHEHFHFRPCIASTDDSDEHYEQLALSVISESHTVENAQVYLSGSPRLVYRSMDLLEKEGFSEEQFFSDVFEYAQREDH